MQSENTIKLRQKESKQISSLTEAFLASGGKIRRFDTFKRPVEKLDGRVMVNHLQPRYNMTMKTSKCTVCGVLFDHTRNGPKRKTCGSEACKQENNRRLNRKSA